MDSVEDEFAQWERVPPCDLFGDTIWRLPAYRISRYLALRVRRDILAVKRRSRNAADQLESSVDSVGINITEGYGRLHGRERARFYEFALGSPREARDWYARTSGLLPPGIAIGRARLLTRVIKILTVAIPQEREGSSERRLKDARLRSRAPKSPPPDSDKSHPPLGTSTSK